MSEREARVTQPTPEPVCHCGFWTRMSSHGGLDCPTCSGPCQCFCHPVEEARVTQPTTDRKERYATGLTGAAYNLLRSIEIGDRANVHGWSVALREELDAYLAGADRPPEPPTPPEWRARLMALLGPSHPHDEGRECGTCAAYNLLADLGASPPPPDLSEKDRAVAVAQVKAHKAHHDAEKAVFSSLDWEGKGHYRLCNRIVFSGSRGPDPEPPDPCSCGGPDLLAALASQPPSTPREP